MKSNKIIVFKKITIQCKYKDAIPLMNVLKQTDIVALDGKTDGKTTTYNLYIKK